MNAARHIQCLPLLAMCLLLGNGCVTKHLWESGDLEAWKQPATNPNLRVFEADTQRDLLVIYDEYSERSNVTHTRAYWANENQKLIDNGHMPHFVSTNSAARLTSVPVFPAANTTNPPSPPYALVETNGQSFTFYSENGSMRTHNLPFYNDGKGKVEKFVLTPLATGADLTIVGGVIGYIYLGGLASSHASYSIPAPHL